jgi:hypothetical protein
MAGLDPAISQLKYLVFFWMAAFNPDISQGIGASAG